MSETRFSKDILQIDAAREVDSIVAFLRDTVLRKFRRKGAVVAFSGGIDSSVVGALCVRAFGPEKTFGIMMPEEDSSPDTHILSKRIIDSLGIQHALENISPILTALGCYKRRDEAIQSVIPEYGPGWKSKIVLPSIVDTEMMRFFSVVALPPDGREVKARMPLEAYLGVVAATNFKQRTRKMFEYYYADRFNYVATGTPNLLEYELGFFVKNGDGSADVKPIAHLYKSQVYQLAAFLGVPEEIRSRPPTTDTYSLPQSQEEFYFSLPYDQMDLCLYARHHNVSASEVAKVLKLTTEQVERVFKDIDAKRNVANYLHSSAVTLAPNHP